MFGVKIFLLIVSGIGAFYSLHVMINGSYFKIQFLAFFIIWTIEFFLLLKFTKVGIFAFLGASILFYLFVTNKILRDTIGVVNEYD